MVPIYMPNWRPDRRDRRRHSRHKRAGARPAVSDYPTGYGEPGGWPGSLPKSGTRSSARREFAITRREFAVALVAFVGLAVVTLLTDRMLLSSSGGGGPVANPVPVPTNTSVSQTRQNPMSQTMQSSPPSPSVSVPARSPSATPRSSSVASPSPSPTPATTRPRQPIVVRYFVVQQQSSGFDGEVEVINNGPSSLAGWQIVVALPNDEITSFSNASGYVSNHILLLGPAPDARPVGPGGVLRVFFVAEGQQTSPELCAFNNLSCS
jgi:hypothetical protein